MRRWIAAVFFFVMPGIAHAADLVKSTLIPDGTYTVHVDMIVDAKNMVVKLDNGLETSLTTNRDNISFDRLAAHDTVRVTLTKGMVIVLVKA